MTSAILDPVARGAGVTTTDGTVAPLSPTQRDMADAIARAEVFFHAPTATYFAADGVKIGRSRGRTLREMRLAGLIEEGAASDAQGRALIVLTELGDARRSVI